MLHEPDKGGYNNIRSFMRTTLIAAMLLGSGSVFGAETSVGIVIDPPPPPYVVDVLPPSPSPEFVGVAGYWTRPPYAGARRMSPHCDGEYYIAGYWESNQGRVEHDHHWDWDHERNYHEDHDRHHGRHNDQNDDR